MIKTAVIGHPISHSKSPLIHNYWIKKHGLNGTYEAIDIAPENLKRDVQNLIDEGYEGFNVTIPHKETIIKLCEDIDDNAKAIGAVNTVTIKDGKLFGSNTDSFGFLANIKQAYPDFNFKDGAALVIGAGGAARAILKGLAAEGVPKIILANRTKSRAQNLASISEIINVIDWEDRNRALRGINLLVNTTSLGMAGQAPLGLNLDELPSHALVNDIVYSPLETELLKSAKGRGSRAVTGIGMLLHQARPAFQKWHGIMPEVDTELEELTLR